MQAVLELCGITKRFGSLIANDQIHFAVEEGTVHAIIGENGAGKSTLMNIICGLYRPDEGTVKVDGKPVRFKNPNEAADVGIGMVHQEFMLFPELTVLDNIMMGCERTRGGLIDRRRVYREIEQICKDYHFNIPLDRPVEQLSVSMLQQVEIVKILYRKARIIIFDEPTSVLTPQGIEGLFDAIRFLVKNGKTILFITHKLKEVLEIADQITVLKNGRCVGHADPKTTNEKELASIMVGREVLLTATKLPREFGEPVLRVEHLSVCDEDGRLRVKDLSFEICRGEIMGIAGVAGSGQQQLSEAIFGLCKAENGRILLDGQEITSLGCRQRRLAGIGYIPQDRIAQGINPKGSLWENAIMGRHITPAYHSKFLLRKKHALQFTRRIVEEFAVKTPGLEVKISNLSGGNIQKLIVGREFLQDNRLLIIEDPTRGIDIGAIEFIWKKIEALAMRGVAVLLISHELNEVMEVSDTLQVMYDGRLYPAGTHHEKSEMEIGLLMTGGDSNAQG